ncbi:MAG TPA: glycosyltransferase [Flavobacteriaceae bacterium]
MGGINRKIKILYTIPNFDTAGSGKVLYDLAKGLDTERFEVSIACTHNKGSFFKDVEALGFPIYLIGSTVPLRPYHSLFFRVRPFKDFIKTHHFDIVHSWHWSSDWTEVLATRLAGARFVYTKKAMGWGNIHWKIRSVLSNFIITINDEMRSFFPYKKQQQLIPLGIDTNFYDPKRFEKKHNTAFSIITVGQFVPIKGIEVLIKSVGQLNDLNICLSIMGTGDTTYINMLRQLVSSLKMDSKVNFIDRQEDIRPYLAGSDLYVIPTLDTGRKEGMPMALVEAMCMGLPVLGSNISGINFVLKEFSDLLFEPGDDKSLSLKIQDMYLKTSEERTNLGKQLREYCVSNFSMRRFINAHEALYLDLKNIKRS